MLTYMEIGLFVISVAFLFAALPIYLYLVVEKLSLAYWRGKFEAVEEYAKYLRKTNQERETNLLKLFDGENQDEHA